MFIFLTMFLLFLKITSEQNDNTKTYFINKGNFLKNYPQEKEITYENKDHNLEALSQQEGNPVHPVIYEDPEFPLYRDSQVLLDNRDAEINGQIKGIKRCVSAEKNEKKDKVNSNKEVTQNGRAKNKLKSDLSFFILRNKRNADNNVRLKTDLEKKSSNLFDQIEFYDNEQVEKRQDLKDLSAYRPNEECFQTNTGKNTNARQKHPAPIIEVEDYIQDENIPLNKTASSVNIGVNISGIIEMNQTILSTRNTYDPKSTSDYKGKTTGTSHPSKTINSAAPTNISQTTSNRQLNTNKTTDSPPITKGTTEDMCINITPVNAGGSLFIPTLDKLKLCSKLIYNGSSSKLEAKANMSDSVTKSQIIKQTEENSSTKTSDYSAMATKPKFDTKNMTSNWKQTTIPLTNVKNLNSSLTKQFSQISNDKVKTNNSAVNSTQGFTFDNSGVLNCLPYNLTTILLNKDRLTHIPVTKGVNFTKTKKSLKDENSTSNPLLLDGRAMKYFNSSVFEDKEDLTVLKTDLELKLNKTSEHAEAENLNGSFVEKVTINLNNTEYSIKNKILDGVSDKSGKSDLYCRTISKNVQATTASNIPKITLPPCKPVARPAKKDRYTIFLEQIQHPNVTHESIYYAYHNKTTVTRRTYTFYSVSGYPTTHPPSRRFGGLLHKLTNNSIVSNKSTTKSSVITLRHKDPCKEVEEGTSKPLFQKVLGMVPKPTDKIPHQNSTENECATVKHKKVYPIRHKGGDPGNHYYHGKHGSSKEKCKNTLEHHNLSTEPMSAEISQGQNNETGVTTEQPGKLANTHRTVESFITKRKIGQGKKDSIFNQLKTSTAYSEHDTNKCTTCRTITNDIKDILPQRFHKEFFNKSLPEIQPMDRAKSISQIQKKPKDKLILCTNKTSTKT